MSTTETPAVIYRGDEHPETFRENSADAVGPFALATINMARTEIVNLRGSGRNDAADDVLAAINRVHDLTIPETYLLNAQRAANKQPYHPVFFSPQITAAMITALEKAEDHLRLWGEGEKPHTEVQRALRRTGRRLVETWNSRKWQTYDIWFVAVPEDLDDYASMPENLRKQVQSIDQIRFFDRNTVHNFNTYWTEFLEMRVTVADDCDETLRDEIEDWVREANSEASTEGEHHTTLIDQIIAKNAPWTVYHYGNPGFDLDEVRDDVLDELARGMNRAQAEKSLPPLSAEEVERIWADDLPEQIDMAVMEKVHEGILGNNPLA